MRQERYGARGIGDMDKELAGRIVGDAKFQVRNRRNMTGTIIAIIIWDVHFSAYAGRSRLFGRTRRENGFQERADRGTKNEVRCRRYALHPRVYLFSCDILTISDSTTQITSVRSRFSTRVPTVITVP